MFIDSAVFYTNDIERVVAFYLDKLGFTLEYRQEDRFVAFIFENGVRLSIKLASQEREKPGSQSVFIGVDDIHHIHQVCLDLGLNFHKPLSTMAGFGDNFAVYDPDGNKIEFVQREASPSV